MEKTKLDYKTYVHASKPLIDEAAFYHRSSCMIAADDSDDGTYHIFNGCLRAMALDIFYVLNVEAAKSVGYSPCKDCFPEGSDGYGDLEDFMNILELAGVRTPQYVILYPHCCTSLHRRDKGSTKIWQKKERGSNYSPFFPYPSISIGLYFSLINAFISLYPIPNPIKLLISISICSTSLY